MCACALVAGCAFDPSGVARASNPDAEGPGADRSAFDSRILLLDSRPQDAVRERSPVDHRPGDQAPARDVRPWPDTVVLKPDTGGCLVESFSSGQGQVQPKTGHWVVSAGAMRQDQTGAGNYAAIGGVTASNYVASALVTVNSLFPKPTGWIIGASLGVRLQGGSGTPNQYLCGIYPGSQALVIVHCSGGDPSSTCFIVSQKGPSITVGQKVLVRAKVVGSTLTCELPNLGGTTYTSTAGTGSLTSGGPTLITQFVDASYDDLTVCPLP